MARDPADELRRWSGPMSNLDETERRSLFDSMLPNGRPRIEIADALRNNWFEIWYQPQIDLASGRLVPVREMLRNLQQVLEEDIVALAAGETFEQLWKILQHGTSAHRQLAIYRDRRNAGEGRLDALQAVVDWLADASMPTAET